VEPHVSGYANTYTAAGFARRFEELDRVVLRQLRRLNFITVDKRRYRRLVMGLSVRLFGLSS